jgi:Na+-translocating ferredoxin:NAD+ oxidoreductase RnfG subunit
MIRNPLIPVSLSLSLIGGVSPFVMAKTYLSVEEAKQVIFPGKYFSRVRFEISTDIQQQLKKISGIHHPLKNSQFWLANDGTWFIVDEVVGKHEMITYAVGVHSSGKIKEVQILEYNETYGHQIREQSWRNQFVDKESIHQIRLNQDIANISGATLSCKHVTDGIRRLMALHSLLLRKLKSHDAL